MKPSIFRLRIAKPSGFTLVELLVVIGIIAILAGAVLAGAGSVIKAAKRAKAAQIANSIQTAVLAYNTEYGVYPVPSTETAGKDFVIGDTSTDKQNWGYLLYGLCGNINPYTALATPAPSQAPSNTHAVPFLNLKKSDVDANNAPLNPLPPDTVHIYFNIAIDNDYDGVLGVTPSNVTTMPNFGVTPFTTAAAAGGGTSTAGVAVWANCNTTTTINGNFYVKTY